MSQTTQGIFVAVALLALSSMLLLGLMILATAERRTIILVAALAIGVLCMMQALSGCAAEPKRASTPMPYYCLSAADPPPVDATEQWVYVESHRVDALIAWAWKTYFSCVEIVAK